MVGHKNGTVNRALWAASGRPEQSGKQEVWEGAKKARKERIRLELEGRAAPDFWTEYLPAVVIESDEEEGGPISFVPYGYQERFFRAVLEERENVLWVKERQLGASWCLAIVAWYMAAYHESAHVGIISMGQREANELMRKVRYVSSHLPEELQRETVGWSEIEFVDSRSILKAFPSKESTGVSFRFRLLLVDEAARHPYGAENYKEYRPSIARGGQLVVCSTSDPSMGRSGFFFDLVQRTLDGTEGWNGQYLERTQELKGASFLLLFNGKYSRPEHDEGFYEKERLEYPGSDAEFDSHYPLTIDDAFTGASGLVYNMFDPQLHVRTDDPMGWEDYTYRLVGIDPGGGDLTAMVCVGVWQDEKTGVLRFHEVKGGVFAKRGAVSADEIVEWIYEWETRGILTRIYDGSTGGQTLLATLQRYFGKRAWSADRDRSGIGVMAGLLEQQRLTIHESNVESVKEFYGYRWLDRVDPNDKTRYRTATPVDNHADRHDARRYAIVTFLRRLERDVASGYRTPRDKRLEMKEKGVQSGVVSLKWDV